MRAEVSKYCILPRCILSSKQKESLRESLLKSLTYCIPMLREFYSQFLGARRHSACTKTQLRRKSHTWKDLEVVATKDWQLRCIFKLMSLQ
jgi:hypothetical protein